MKPEVFHDAHRDQWERDAADQGRKAVHESWFRTDTTDHWRHARMYEGARAFLHRPDLSWLTVGDGRFGLDSIRLRNFGFTNVLPTDIGDALLREAKADGHIDDYAVENAERLSFGDDSFDLVLCKESYHHFPRAPLALFEMLRVARVGVVLIEPRDYVVDHGTARLTGPAGLLRGLAGWARNRAGVLSDKVKVRERYLLGDPPDYEESGNYKYMISSRELEKVALGSNLPALALKGLNDCYIRGGETEEASARSPVFKQMQIEVSKADRRTEAGLGSTSMLLAILFKSEPDTAARNFLNENDWLLLDLPRNPHVR
jgi:SAM-dependent methyltransferase